jgi:small-conductance mechanosensitive channel
MFKELSASFFVSPGFDRLLIPAAIAISTLIGLLLVRNIVFRVLSGWAKNTQTTVDDIIIDSLKTPTIYWCMILSLYIGVSVSELPDRYMFYFKKSVQVLLLLSVTFAISGFSGNIFRSSVQKIGLPIPATGLAYGILKGAIITIGALITLSAIGISITPLITALGVGGLAVALALQDTLANLFAGIHIMMEKSVRVGDFIKLESGQEGSVEDITWRTTRIRMLPNNIVVIPNSKLSQSILTNYYLPEKKMALLIPISVSYSSDPERVEKILIEEAKKAVNRVPGMIGEPEPFVRFRYRSSPTSTWPSTSSGRRYSGGSTKRA